MTTYAYILNGIVQSVGNVSATPPEGQIAVPDVAEDRSVAEVGGSYMGATISIFGPAPSD